MKISSVALLALVVVSLGADIEGMTWAELGMPNVECPASHFDLVGRYTLGKQDELNRTFAHIQSSIKQIGNITFNSSGTTQYTIYNTKPTFYYRDSRQKADILGNDTIVVYGGRVEVDITFNWIKTNVITRNGTGACFGLSDMISFAKQIVIENGSSYSYELLDYEEVTWNEGEGEPFRITRVDPADASDEDKAVLRRMLNNILGYKTIRNQLEEEIDKIYSYLLRASLHDEHQHIDPQFDYIWNPGFNRSNITIPMARRPLFIDIEKDGIRTGFDIQVQGALDWQCGNRTLPLLPLNPAVYGNLQQFVSYDFYKNMLRHAIEKGYLDTNLERQRWESKMFQFFAGDLYEIFPLLQQKYYANEKIEGNCKATYSNFKIYKHNHDSFNVSLSFDCELNVRKQKFVDFAVGLNLEVEGVPQRQFMNFKLRAHEQFSSFYEYGPYKMQNKKLAELMVSHSVNRMYEGNLFGSGFPVSPPRDYPNMLAQQNYTVVYDSTHVDPDMSPEMLADIDYLDLSLQ